MLKQNLILLFSVTLFLMISIANANADVQNIAKITNEEDKGVIGLEFITDENQDITHLKLIFKNEKNEVDSIDKYTAQRAATGIVLYKVDGREVVKLKSDNFSSHQGGEIELNYLYNGITGSRGFKRLDLSRDGDIWKLNDNGKDISNLHFVSNKKVFFGTIGIKSIISKSLSISLDLQETAREKNIIKSK